MAPPPKRRMFEMEKLNPVLADLSSSSPERVIQAAKRIPDLLSRTLDPKPRTLAVDRLLDAYNHAAAKLRKAIPNSGSLINHARSRGEQKAILGKIMQQVEIAKQVRIALDKLGFIVPESYIVFTPRPDSTERLLLPDNLSRSDLGPKKTIRIRLAKRQEKKPKPAKEKPGPAVAAIHPLLKMRVNEGIKPAELKPLTDADLQAYLEKNPKLAPEDSAAARWRRLSRKERDNWIKAVKANPRIWRSWSKQLDSEMAKKVRNRDKKLIKELQENLEMWRMAMFAKAVPKPPEGFAFDLSGKPLAALDPYEELMKQRGLTYEELMKQRGWRINPFLDIFRRMYFKYRKITHIGMLIVFPFDLAAGIIEAINKGGTMLLAPALSRLEGDLGDMQKRRWYQRLAKNRTEMRKNYGKAFETGRAGLDFVNALIVDRETLNTADVTLLKKVIRNQKNEFQTRLAALYALDKLGKEHASFFSSLIGNKRLEKELRIFAAYTLLKINTPEALAAVRRQRDIYISALATKAQLDKDKSAIGKLDYVVRSSGYTTSEKVLAASGLTTIGEKKGLVFLAGSLKHKDPKVRGMASAGLMQLNWRGDVQDAIIRKMKDPDPSTRALAALTLTGALSKRAVKSMAPLMSDADRKVCISSAKAMGEIAFRGTTSTEPSDAVAGKMAEKQLLKLYNKGGDAKTIASLGLLSLEDVRATKGILLGVKSRSPLLRSSCAAAIPVLLERRMITSQNARNALLGLLNDQSEDVRAVATLALSSIPKIPSMSLKMRPKE